jgi:outer membrane protein assembly factor BamD
MGLDQRVNMKKRLLVVALLSAACSNRHDIDVGSVAGRSDRLVWEAGEKAFSKKRWVEARQQFKRIVDGFPNSEYVPMARLRLADAYFRDGGAANFVLATSEYRQFLTLFPSRPESAYAQFQTAECFFSQRNGADRDQTPIQQALDEYQKLLTEHPESEYVAKANGRIGECRQLLARSEFLVGFFYQRTRKAHFSAVDRYKAVLKRYPEYARTDEVLFRLSECLVAWGKRDEAVPYLTRLLADYPQSPFAASARRLLQKAQMPHAPEPTPTPKPGPEPAHGTAAP